MKLSGFFWRYFRPYSAWAGVALVAVVLYAASTTSMVVLFEPIFGEVLLAGERDVPGELSALAGAAAPAAEASKKPPTPWERLAARLNLREAMKGAYSWAKQRLGITPENVVYFVPLLFVGIFLLRSLADFASGYVFQRVGLGMTNDMRDDLYHHILAQSSRFHAAHPSGELVARVINDVALLQSAVSNRLLDLFQQSITLLSLIVLLISTNPRLALICLVVAPALVYPIVRFGRSLRKTSHRSQERLADLTAVLSEGVRNYRVVKAFGMESFEHGRFQQATRKHLKVNLRAQMLSQLSGPVVESLAVLGAAALLVWAGESIRQGSLTPALLISFLSNLFLMYDPIRKLNKVNLVLQQAIAASQRIGQLLVLEPEVLERPGSQPITTVREAICYEAVHFSYGHDESPVLTGVDLEIRQGQVVALVGHSGAGKSTLVNLLPRFFDPNEGQVTIDGVDVRELRLKDLRALIGIVSQETVLFNETIRNNIAYGRSDLPMERVREAAAAAYADEFVMRLPHGYETVVGEAGLRLSGGQRQRLAIARALLKNAPILILDEATSQLDSESEALVQKALHNLMQGRTTLVIAHRLSTVMRADRIVVMEQGEIVESGTHLELLALAGTYKRLYDLQFRD